MPEIDPATTTKAPETEADQQDLLLEIAQREEAVKKRELAFAARERIMEWQLPEGLIAHLNLDSQEGLESSLALAKEAYSFSRTTKGAPLAAKPSLPPFATYLERARLFEEDPAAYALMREQNHNQ